MGAGARASRERAASRRTIAPKRPRKSSFDDFAEYFDKFFRATRLLRPLIRNTRWVFTIDKPQTEYWTVDFGRGTIDRSDEMPERYDSAISVSPAVLSGSLRNDVFTNVDISKRWRVHISRGSAMRHFVMTNLLLLYEAEYLSPKRLLSWRFLSGYARRFPEVLDYVRMAITDCDEGQRFAGEAVTSIAEG